MPDKDKQIVEIISSAIPHLTDAQQERLLAFGEGVALMAVQQAQASA